MRNPCLKCGACCAHYRVSFYWGEADPEQGGIVPLDMVQDIDSFRRCMNGTNQPDPRCTALQGEIGQEVHCTIYENRPTPCREFGAVWKAAMLYFPPGEIERCNEARAAYGLAPLDPPVLRPRHARHRRYPRPAVRP
jgi:Fe-S-cluster containining protein